MLPIRYPYWRAQLIHADRYAGIFCFGMKGSWWDDELGYSYNSAYTDAAWDWLEGYIGGLDNFMKMTGTGGEFENQVYVCHRSNYKGFVLPNVYRCVWHDSLYRSNKP